MATVGDLSGNSPAGFNPEKPIFGAADSAAGASHSFAITPSDTTDLERVTRALTIGVAGDVAIRRLDGTEETLTALPAGTHPISCDRILSTGTTATDITGHA